MSSFSFSFAIALALLGAPGTEFEKERDGTAASPSAAAGLRPGLVARYADGGGELITTAASPSFFLRADESLHPQLRPAFRAEWLGRLVILEGGVYTFSAGEAELVIDGERADGRTRELDAGLHALRLAYRRAPGPARLELRWKSGFFPEEPVPHTALVHDPDDPRWAAALRERSQIERGRALVEDHGCVNCHAASESTLPRRLAPELRASSARLRPSWVYRWLEAPARVRSGASMPALLREERDRRDVAAFLAPREAPPRESPRSRHDPARGEELFGIIGCRACHAHADLRLDGLGSKLGLGALTEYLRDPRAHDPGGRMPDLALSLDEASALAAYLIESRRPELEAPIPRLDAADPRRGRSLVESSGCLACHRIAIPGGEAPKNRLVAPRLAALSPEKGCLAAERVDPGLPLYELETGERRAIRAFLVSHAQRPDLARAPLHESERSIARLRCTACHRRREDGPSVALQDRVPDLDAVGAKLRPRWLENVLVRGARVRTESRLRMPSFRGDAVASLGRGLSALAGIDPDLADGPGVRDDEAIEQGTVLLGSAEAGGLACITCHDFRDHRPVADEKGPQLITTAERLRFDWFRRWMYYPGRIVSGTSMPQFFSTEPSAETDRKIEALWAAFSLGGSMREPPGLGASAPAPQGEALPVPPPDEAIVLRFPLPGATAAAIAVGLPGQAQQPAVSFCFDASFCRLVYAWRGGFLDLRGSLAKKQEQPKLLGEIFFRGESLPFRLQSPDQVPATRFRGYRIVEGYPEFRYELDGVRVFERVVPLRDAVGFVREFRLLGLDRPAWFAAPAQPGVTTSATIGRFENGLLRLPPRPQLRFEVHVEGELDDG